MRHRERVVGEYLDPNLKNQATAQAGRRSHLQVSRDGVRAVDRRPLTKNVQQGQDWKRRD
jgi:ribosomal protein L28